MRRTAIRVVLALVALGLIGCARRETVTTEERVAYRRESEGRLERLGAELDSLIERGRARGVAEWDEKMIQLRAQRDSVQSQLDRIESAGDEAWEDVKSGTERMLGRLEDSIGDARGRISSREDSLTRR